MIVQCDQCEAKYRIADEKITGQGVRVRCAKCDNVFTVEPPPASEQGTATSTDDVQTGHANGGDEPRSDSLSPPPSEDKIPDQKQASEDHMSKDEPEQQPSEGLGDFSGSGEISGTGSDPPEAERPPLPDLTNEDHPLGRAEEAFTQHDADPPDSHQTPLQSSDEKTTEDPGMDWGNIALDSQQKEDRTVTDMDLSTSAPPKSTDYDPGPSLDQPSPQPFPSHEEASPPHRETTTASRAAAPPRPVKKGGKGLFFLLILVLLSVGGYFAYPRVQELVDSRNQTEQGTLVVQDIVVGTVKQQDGVLLAIVRGKIRNDTSGSKGMIQVQGTFRGPDGRPLAESTSYCGNTFTDRELATNDLTNIRSSLSNELGQSLSNSSLKPGD
ncbi:hypothetical protein EP232_02410, partial [bacterium]